MKEGGFKERRWKTGMETKRVSPAKQKSQELMRTDEAIRNVMEVAAREAALMIGEARAESRRLGGLKDVLERELEFTKRMLLNLQQELR